METALDSIALNNIEGEMTESRAEVEGSSAAEPGSRTILEMHGAKILAALAMLVIGWMAVRTLPHIFGGALHGTEADQDGGAVQT